MLASFQKVKVRTSAVRIAQHNYFAWTIILFVASSRLSDAYCIYSVKYFVYFMAYSCDGATFAIYRCTWLFNVVTSNVLSFCI